MATPDWVADCDAKKPQPIIGGGGAATSQQFIKPKQVRPPSYEWAVTSALIVALPGALHGQVQAVRAKHDKAFGRWMPHINLMFPFVLDDSTETVTIAGSSSCAAAASSVTAPVQSSQFAAVAELLRRELASMPSFRLWFEGLSAFNQGKCQTVHLHPQTDPPDAFEKLWKQLKKVFPGYLKETRARHELKPHMTLGQWPAELSIADIQAQLQLDKVIGVEIVVDSLSMISRFKEPPHFVERHQIALAPVQQLTPGCLLTSVNQAVSAAPQSTAVAIVGEEQHHSQSKASISISEDNVQLQVSFASDVSKEKRKVVFVCDTSGSMSGLPRSRVEATVEEMLQAGHDFDIINYSARAVLLKAKPGCNVLEQLRQTWFCSGTNFCQAFECMREVLCDPVNDKSALDFIFLTDGQPSDSPLSKSPVAQGVNLWQLREHIAQRAQRTGQKAVIHSFGLGRGASCELLETLRLAGTAPGVFSYAAPSDPNATAELSTLMSFATTSKSLQVLVDDDDDDAAEPRTAAFYVNGENGQLVGELWVPRVPRRVVVQVSEAERVVIDSVVTQQGDRDHELARLRRDIYLCRESGHVFEIERRLLALRTGLPRYLRQEMMAELLDLEGELAQVRAILAEQASQRLTSGSDVLARFKAMSFRGAMSKVRRERVMDRRTLANQRLLRDVEQQLQALPALTAEQAVEHDANPLFRDDISQDSLSEIMQGSSSDLLVVGLSVQRDEVAIDQPVTVCVQLGHTLLSWMTLETAADYEMSKGNATATGTFSVSTVSRLLAGVGNENINAGLPLFCSEQHYQRVRIMLPVICGYFFTLSPTGFAASQLPALFAVLARLHRQAKNERAQAIVEEFRRICERIMYDEPLLDTLRIPPGMRPRNIIDLFCTSAESRKKSELPSLDILYGCLLADSSKQLPANFQQMVLCEAVRRHLNFAMSAQQSGGDVFHGTVRRLIYGPTRHPEAVVSVSKPAAVHTNDSGEAVFAPVVFHSYVPLQLQRTVDDEILAALKVPKLVDEFIERTKACGLTLTQADYEAALYGSLVQAAYAPGNDGFSQLVAENVALLDPLDDAAVQRMVEHIHASFDRFRQERWAAAVRNQENEENAIFLAFSAETVEQFCLGLRALRVARGLRVWQELVALIADVNHWPLVPVNVEKLAVMLTGRDLEQAAVIENGAPWMAGSFFGRICRERLRPTPFYRFVEELDDLALEHQYRVSDLPNRHGHHRSRPLWVAQPDHPSVKQLCRKWDA